MGDMDNHKKILMGYCRICGSCERTIDQHPNRRTNSDFVTKSLQFLNVDLLNFTFHNEDPDIFPHYICYICYRKLNYFDHIKKQGKIFHKIDTALYESHSDNCAVCLRQQIRRIKTVKPVLPVSLEISEHYNDKQSRSLISETCIKPASSAIDDTSYEFLITNIKTEIIQEELSSEFKSSEELSSDNLANSSDAIASTPEACFKPDCSLSFLDRKLKILDTGEINAKIKLEDSISVKSKINEENISDNNDGNVVNEILSPNNINLQIVVEKENEDPLCLDNNVCLPMLKDEKTSCAESVFNMMDNKKVCVELDNQALAAIAHPSKQCLTQRNLSHEERLSFFCRLCGQMKIGIAESSIGLLKTSHNVQKHIRKILQVNVFDEPSSIYPPAVCLECCDMLKSNFISLSTCRKLTNLDLKIVAFEPHHEKSCVICSFKLPKVYSSETSIYYEKAGNFFPISHKEIILKSLKAEEKCCTKVEDKNVKDLNNTLECIKKNSDSKSLKKRVIGQKMKGKLVNKKSFPDLNEGKNVKLKGTPAVSDKFSKCSKTYDKFRINFKFKEKPIINSKSEEKYLKKLSKKNSSEAVVERSSSDSCLKRKYRPSASPKLRLKNEQSSLGPFPTTSGNIVKKISKSINEPLTEQTPKINNVIKPNTLPEKQDINLLWDEEKIKAIAIMKTIFIKISEELGEPFDEETFEKLFFRNNYSDQGVQKVEEITKMVHVMSNILTTLGKVLNGRKMDECSKGSSKLDSPNENFDSKNRTFNVCSGLLNLGNECFAQLSEHENSITDLAWKSQNKRPSSVGHLTDLQISDQAAVVILPQACTSNSDKKIKVDSFDSTNLFDCSDKGHDLSTYNSSNLVNGERSGVDLHADLSSIEADVVSYLASSKLQNNTSHHPGSSLSTSTNNLVDNVSNSPLLKDSIIISNTSLGDLDKATTSSNFNFCNLVSENELKELPSILPNVLQDTGINCQFKNLVEAFKESEKFVKSDTLFENSETFLSDDEDILCPEVIEKLKGKSDNQMLSGLDKDEITHFSLSESSNNKLPLTPIIVSHTSESVTISIPEDVEELHSEKSIQNPNLLQCNASPKIQFFSNQQDNQADNSCRETSEKNFLPLILEDMSVTSISQEEFKTITDDASPYLNEVNVDLKKSIKKPVIKRHHCPVCAKLFRKPCDVKRHLRTHTGEKPFKCELCDKMFSVRSTLKLHEKAHTENRLIECDVCSASFSTLGSLKSHKKTHDYSLFPCLFCPHKFITSQHWKRHMTIHHSTEISVNNIQIDNITSSDDISRILSLKGTGNVAKMSLKEANVFKTPLLTNKTSLDMIENLDISTVKQCLNIESGPQNNVSARHPTDSNTESGKDIVAGVLREMSTRKLTSESELSNNTSTSVNIPVSTKTVSKKAEEKVITNVIKKCDLSKNISLDTYAGSAKKFKSRSNILLSERGIDISLSDNLSHMSDCQANAHMMSVSNKFVGISSHSPSSYQMLERESNETDVTKTKSSEVTQVQMPSKSLKINKTLEKSAVIELQCSNSLVSPSILTVTHDSEQREAIAAPQMILEDGECDETLSNELNSNFNSQSEIIVHTDGSFSLEKPNTLNSETTLNVLCDRDNGESRVSSKVLNENVQSKCGKKYDFKLKNTLGCKLKLIEVPVKSDGKKKIKKTHDSKFQQNLLVPNVMKMDATTQHLRERGIDIEPVFDRFSTTDDGRTKETGLTNSKMNSLVVQVGINEVGKPNVKGSGNLLTNKLRQPKHKFEKTSKTKARLGFSDSRKSKSKKHKLEYNESKAQTNKLEDNTLENLLDYIKTSIPDSSKTIANYKSPSNVLPQVSSNLHKRKILSSKNRRIAGNQSSLSKKIVNNMICTPKKNASKVNGIYDGGAIKSSKERCVQEEKSLQITEKVMDTKITHSSVIERKCQKSIKLHTSDENPFGKKIKLDVVTPHRKLMDENNAGRSSITVENSQENLDITSENKLTKTVCSISESRVPLVKEEEDSIVISWVD